MKKLRIISLLLVAFMLLGVLASCGGSGNVVNNAGDRVNGSWEGVDFKGQAVNISLSVNKYVECSFPAASVYTKGPDSAGSNEVAKEVLARNARASEDLGIEIVYANKDLTYDKIQEDVRTIVQTSSKNSPDIYNNDMYGLSRAMIDGLLWNVKNPGDDVKNYFDFNAEGWYTDFMKGCTFDQEKLYLFAGDYFIDMIRMAWIVLVNNDLMTRNIEKLPTWCLSTNEFYEYVAAGFWDLDILGDFSSRVFVEGSGGVRGETEKDDATVGFAMNHTTDWIMSAASDVTLYYQDKADGLKPKVMESIDTYQKVSDKYTAMAESQGVYWEQEVKTSTDCFLQGNFLFAMSRLGEMESSVLRDFDMAKGLVPVPKWEQDSQEDYHTVVHDQAEIGCILNTAKAFAASSALMQYLNEESDLVVYTYYEKGLKYKYNDDKNSREMMDIVRETTDSPFGWQIGKLCETLYTGTGGALHSMWIEENKTCASTFAQEKDSYKDCMQKMIDKFALLQ